MPDPGRDDSGDWAGHDFVEKSIQRLVAEDVMEREQFGIEKYGAAIHAHSTPIDPVEGGPLGQAYRELLDLVVYMRWYQEIKGSGDAFSYGALRAIQTGEWDRHLHLLQAAIKKRLSEIK